MRCLNHQCPLKNKAFASALDKWALLGRTPKALNPEPSPGGSYNPEWSMLKKCRIALLFKDDGIVLDYIMSGKMTKAICKELVSGERKFKAMRWREKYGQ